MPKRWRATFTLLMLLAGLLLAGLVRAGAAAAHTELADRGLQVPTPGSPTQSPVPAPTLTAAQASSSGQSGQRSATAVVLGVLAWGAAVATVGLVAFGAYVALRPRVRAYLGRLRTRRMHKNGRERDRRGETG